MPTLIVLPQSRLITPQYSPQEKFRWVDNDAQVVVDLPSDPSPPLILDLEPDPGVGRQPFRLQIRDAADTVVAEAILAQRLRLEFNFLAAAGE